MLAGCSCGLSCLLTAAAGYQTCSWGLGRAAVCDCGTPWTFLALIVSADLSKVVCFVLRFYGPVNPMGSCRARSVGYHTCSLELRDIMLAGCSCGYHTCWLKLWVSNLLAAAAEYHTCWLLLLGIMLASCSCGISYLLAAGRGIILAGCSCCGISSC